MSIFALAFTAFIAILLSLGCGGNETSANSADDLPDTWLSEIIQTVPSDMRADYLLFANYAKARLEADATSFEGFDTLLAEGPDSVPWTYAMLPDMGMFTSYSQSAKDIIGLDTLGLDQGIWSPVAGSSKPPFSITAGGLKDPRQIYTRLGEAGFNTTFHYGLLLLYFWRDDPPGPRELMEHPMRTNLLQLNAIALIEDRLAIAREVETLERLIEVHDGKTDSLRSEAPWRILTQSVGDDLLGGALIPPEHVVSRTATGSEFGRSAEERLEDWRRYADAADAWGTLEPYTALVVGYGAPYGTESAIIAMYHPDPDSAELNAAELKRRWGSARLDLRGYADSDPTLDIPFTELCAPLETRVETHESSSVLIATCPVIERSNPTLIGALGRDFWKGLVAHHELHFLAPDIGEVTRK